MGLSNIEVKKANRNSILQYMLSIESAAKSSVAEALRLSVPTVTQGLKELEAAGLIEEDGIQDSIGGRKAKTYCCKKNAKVALGIDITANHVNLVMLNLAKQVLYSKRVRMKMQDQAASYEALRAVIDEVVEESQIPAEKILGLGISLPAIVDESGTKIYALHEQMELSHELYEIVKSWYPFPVLLGNDANSAGKAELGPLHTEKNTVYFFVSQTVGGAIMLEGQGFYGIHCRAGELGHMTLVPGGRPCYCGRTGCVDAYCSTKLLSDRTEGNLEQFFQCLEAGNEAYGALWEEYLDYLALAVHNVNTVFDSEVIIGGYLGQYMEPYMDALRERVRKIDPYLSDMSFLKPAALKYEAAAVGAASIFIDDFIANR